jgi:hypothetical protein
MLPMRSVDVGASHGTSEPTPHHALSSGSAHSVPKSDVLWQRAQIKLEPEYKKIEVGRDRDGRERFRLDCFSTGHMDDNQVACSIQNTHPRCGCSHMTSMEAETEMGK